MRIAGFAVAILLALAPSARAEPLFSSRAREAWQEIATTGEASILLSPDGVSSAHVSWLPDRSGVAVRVRGAIGDITVPFRPGVGIELIWRDDSRALAVTSSDAGLNGGYRTVVIGRFGGELRAIDVSDKIYEAFGHPVRCDYPETPNVVAVRWADHSNRLIVAAEIIHHTICDSYGTFRAYEVDLPSLGVTHTWNQIEARRLFGSSLGLELRAARDYCIVTPRVCRVAYENQRRLARQARQPHNPPQQ